MTSQIAERKSRFVKYFLALLIILTFTFAIVSFGNSYNDLYIPSAKT